MRLCFVGLVGSHSRLLLPVAGALVACGGTTIGVAHDAGKIADATTAIPVDAACPTAMGAATGTLTLGSAFSAPMQSADVFLFQTFPSPSSTALYATSIDGTNQNWGFGCIPAGNHYYVEGVAHFLTADGSPASVPAIVGPITVPSAAPVPVQVQPVEIEVLESRAPGSGMLAQWASAHVFDPATGVPVTNATVTIDAGTGTPLPLPWGQNPNGQQAYFVSFLQPPSAPPAYTVQVTRPGMAPTSWQVTAAVPTFDGSITSPTSGATVTAAKDLVVTWAPEPQADFEVVTLFGKNAMGAWASLYSSPPVASDQADASVAADASITGCQGNACVIPGSNLGQTGSDLINVAYTRANCPASAAGCVLAQTVPDVTLTVAQ